MHRSGRERSCCSRAPHGFRHASIPAAVEAIEARASTTGTVTVESTEDQGAFNDLNLSRFDAVVFLMTTGDVLDATHEAAFERYVRGGGGYAGVHSATDTEYDWPFYGALVGAYFKDHPMIQPATVVVDDRADPSTRMLPAMWARTDEWYNFRAQPADAEVLAPCRREHLRRRLDGRDPPRGVASGRGGKAVVVHRDGPRRRQLGRRPLRRPRDGWHRVGRGRHLVRADPWVRESEPVGILDKAKGLLGQNKDKAKGAVDKAADAIDDKTGGKHKDKIESGAEKAKDAIDKLAGDQ